MVKKIISSYEMIDKKAWSTLLKESKYANFFQSENCFLFFKSLKTMRAFVYAVVDEGELVALAVGYLTLSKKTIWQHFTQRAIICGGPLFSENVKDKHVKLLMEGIKDDLEKDTIYIEIRNFHNYAEHRLAFEKAGFLYQKHLNFKVNTENLHKMESQISKGRMRDIRLSLREGAEIIENPSWNQVEDFYDILSHLYQKKIRLPLFDIEFFKQLYAMDESLFLLVEYQGQIIGGVVCVALENKAVYEWYACGINGIYDKITATALATYAGMRYAALNKFPIFDMMGAGVPDKEYGVRTFKGKFGGKLVEEGRFLCITKPYRFRIGKFGVSFMRHFGFFH